MGFLSDIFCRRRILIVMHLLAPVLLVLSYFYTSSLWVIVLFGLVYNPLSTIRANLVDNTQEYSRVKLISISFIVQFFPQTFVVLFQDLSKYTSLLLAIGGILISLILGLIFFFDRRDKKLRAQNYFSKIAFFLPKTSTRAIYTFIAFIPSQLAFFVSNNLLEAYTMKPQYYSILSFGALIGACISTLYKKTPHVSVLTIAYGFALMISLLPLGAKYIYGYEHLDIPFMFVALGSVLGFYISFVYDVILHSVSKNYRGTACGLLDFVFGGASILILLLFKELSASSFFALLLISIAYACAVVFQKAAE